MRNNKNIYKVLIYLLIISGAGYFIYKYRENFSDISIQNYFLIIPLAVLTILFFTSNGIVTKIIIKAFKINLSFKEWFGLSTINTLGNYISPFRGGSISNALYLKKKYSFSYNSFISMLSGIYIIVFWINSLIGIIAIIFTNIFYDIFSLPILIIFSVSFIFLSIVILISPQIPLSKSKFINQFIKVINDWNIIRKKLDIVIKLSIIALLNIILMTAMSYFEFQLIGIEVKLLKLLVIALFSTFSIFLSITPASLGIREAFSIYSGQLLGIPVAQLLAISIIDRLINFILALFLGLYFSNKLLNKSFKKKAQNKNEDKIYIVIGTRAQFIKVAPMLRKMIDQNLHYELIYTAQHQETIDEILEVYKLPKPDKVMYKRDEANTRKKFAIWFFYMLYQTLFRFKKWLPQKGYLLTHGDTFTTWLSALMGKLAGCKVCHLESGLRSFNLFKPFPEEISRLITFVLSDVYFCPNNWAMNNLKKYRGEKINMKINPMYDGVVYALEHPSTKNFSFQKKKYAVVSIHRYENIFTSRLTETIIPFLRKISKKIQLVITLHPTTRERLKSLDLYDTLNINKNIILHKRFDFLDWINICNKAEFIITDGGSNQEEFSYLGVPTLLFRTETERREGLGKNIVLSKLDKKIINNFIKNYNDYRKKMIKIKHSPSQIVIDFLKNNMK